MSTISLRAYTHEIENLIDQGSHDQAIAHSKQILSTYPKYLDAYRLLGKAYLESKRLGDGEDIFLRILSSIPDDFISHVGMSIIREDEGNLTESIWHMERAFETQPSNNAIQNELKKLIARRDGIEPIKINLTRVALARMYLKGGLFQQAINELRISLAEEPQRYDLQVLLARAYHQADQNVEAAEACTSILGKLPYCLDANTILYETMQSSQRTDESKVHLARLSELNPYFAFLNASTPTPDLIPDEAIVLEKLTLTPDLAIGKEPEWADRLGVKIDKPDQMPEWLSTGISNLTEGEGEITESQSTASVEGSTEKIPEWMKEAGWSEPVSETIEPEKVSKDVNEPENLEMDNLAPAEIPEWLQSLAPAEPPEPEIPPSSEEISWLDETPPGESDSIGTWLKDLENEEDQVEEALNPAEGVPDWLLALSERAGVGEEIKQYAESFGEDEQIMASPEGEETSLSPDGELPDWLYGFEEEEALEELRNLPSEPEKIAEITKAPEENIVEVVKPSGEIVPAIQEEVPSGFQSDTHEKAFLEEPINEQDTKPIQVIGELDKKAGEPGAQIEQAVIPAWLEDLVKEDATEVLAGVEPSEELEETLEWSKIPLDEQETIELPEWLREEPPVTSEITHVELTPSIDAFAETPTELEQRDEWLQEFIEPKEQPVETPIWSPEPEVPLKANFEQVIIPPNAELEVDETITPTSVPEPEVQEVAPLTEQEIVTVQAEETISVETLSEGEQTPEIPTEEAINLGMVELDDVLNKAHQALAQGDSESAVQQYEPMIKTKKYLPEIIQDINQNLQQHPLDVSLWTSLGDAHMRSGLLQSALDAYIKAEELLR